LRDVGPESSRLCGCNRAKAQCRAFTCRCESYLTFEKEAEEAAQADCQEVCMTRAVNRLILRDRPAWAAEYGHTENITLPPL
jgi:hypothetical protein